MSTEVEFQAHTSTSKGKKVAKGSKEVGFIIIPKERFIKMTHWHAAVPATVGTTSATSGAEN